VCWRASRAYAAGAASGETEPVRVLADANLRPPEEGVTDGGVEETEKRDVVADVAVTKLRRPVAVGQLKSEGQMLRVTDESSLKSRLAAPYAASSSLLT